jgi:hypothetical protein
VADSLLLVPTVAARRALAKDFGCLARCGQEAARKIELQPPAAIFDSQSVGASEEASGTKGYGAAKNAAAANGTC